MAKKKKETSTKRSFTGVLGFTNIFHNEKLNFFLGLLLIGVAVYFIMAFISYFTTGAADQSLIEDPREGEIMNEKHEFGNTCGSLGAYASWYFIKRCFGIPAFMCLQSEPPEVVPGTYALDDLGICHFRQVPFAVLR